MPSFLLSRLILACALVAPTLPLAAEDETPAELVEKICAQLEQREGTRYWSLVTRLEGLGKDAVPALLAKLKQSSEKIELACAKAVLALGDVEARGQAIEALEALAQSQAEKPTRIAAMEILGENGDPDQVLPVLEKIFGAATDPEIVIPLGRVLWDIDRVAEARDRLVSFLGSQSAEVKQSAALALAEMDYFEGEVREVLRTLKREPTPDGRRAAALDRIHKLSRQLDRGLEKGELLDPGADPAKLLKLKADRIRELEDRLERGQKSALALAPRSAMDGVLEEIVLQVQKSYVDEAKTSRDKLILNAIRGLVRGLDEFSSFMDADDTQSFGESLAGEYTGIGAQLNKPGEGLPLEIVRPIYGGPSYKAGILTGDRILEVDGTRTDDVALDEVIGKIKGLAGTTVALKVMRRGWTEPRVFSIERQMVELPSIHTELLPGKIGYLQLSQFGNKAVDEFLGGLDELEKQEMAALVIDLRNNPGGLLEAAVKIVDEFVGEEKIPIVTQKGRGKASRADEIETYPLPAKRANYPIAILINQRSASASEIVAGALKDFGRATLVGKKTFGKGSVQRLIPLSSESQKALNGKAQLRLTVQYYFLPQGRCIHTIRDASGNVVEEGGVSPEIEVAEDKIPTWRYEERERLRGLPAMLDYVDTHWETVKSFFVEGDAHDTRRYPNFDELKEKLETTALAEDVRGVIRYHVRRRLEDQQGKEFACDVQEDLQLGRAILELLKTLGERPESYPRYASLGAKADETTK